MIETVESNICLIRILTHNTNNKMQTLQLINIYNLCSLFFTFIKRSSIISCLSELLKDDCKQLIMKDFNLHHSHWEKWKCFTQHAAINNLLDIVTNAKLKLLLKSDTITCKTYNQFTTIDLVFSSEKIQFMTCKCKVHIDLHQESNHLSIVTELCLQTTSVQSSTQQLWKKMNTEALSAYLCMHLSLNRSLNNKMMINKRVCKVIKMLQKIIEKFIFLTKSSSWAKNFWNLNCLKIVMKSRQLQIIWKIQSILNAWNQYLKHNDHKNKIIQQVKRAYFRSQMHELSDAFKSIWRFAKWVRIKSQLFKKLSQFSSLKQSDTDQMTMILKKKIEILQEKFFLSFSQININNITDSFILLTVTSDLHISEKEVRQIIKRIKVNKASDILNILNRMLQIDLAKLISILMSLFNICVIHRYHSKQFKKTQIIILCKSKKSDYTDSKTYQLIALLDIMSKALKLIMTKRLNNIAETHHMLSDAQMRMRCKQFMISTLDLLIDQIHTVWDCKIKYETFDLLIDQIHTVWDCKIKYVTFMLSLDIVEAFDQVLHIRLLHILKMKKTSNYIVLRPCLESNHTAAR